MATKSELSVKHGWLRAVYTIFLALLVALFWGLGISAFYEGPKTPSSPSMSIEKTAPDSMTVEQKAEVDRFDREQKEYMEKEKVYSKNVSIWALGFAVLTLAVSLVFANRITLMSDGLLLGSIFTLGYSIIRGIASEDVKMRFAVVVVGIVVTVFVGWWKFLKKTSIK